MATSEYDFYAQNILKISSSTSNADTKGEGGSTDLPLQFKMFIFLLL